MSICPKCGICGEHNPSKLLGPYAGGPFSWYCKRCHDVIEKWEKAKLEHHEFMMELIKNVKIEKGMALTFSSEKRRDDANGST